MSRDLTSCERGNEAWLVIDAEVDAAAELDPTLAVELDPVALAGRALSYHWFGGVESRGVAANEVCVPAKP